LTSLAGSLGNAGGHLDALTGGDMTTDLRMVFLQSYRTLTGPAARLFRLLGLHPGPDIGVPAAASLADVGLPQVRVLLSELEAAQLFTEHRPGRYAAHDLLRAYAIEQSQSHDSDTERHDALHRILSHYLLTAHSAARLLNERRAISLPPHLHDTTERFTDRGQAMAWLTAEHQVLLSLFTSPAAASEFDGYIWRLACVMADFLYYQGHWHQWVATQEIALAAATRLDDPEGRRHTHQSVGLAYARLGRHDDALTHLRHALDLSRRSGDQTAQAMAHGILGRAFEMQGRHEQSLHQAQRALALFRTAGDKAGQANALNSIGWEHAELGDYRRALRSCRKALALQREIGDERASANTLDSLGYAYHHLGQHPEAIRCYLAAINAYRRFADRRGEAVSLTHLGDTHHAAGDRLAAQQVWRRALAIHKQLNHPDAEQVQAKLDRLEPA
jgi:tetratricopeptide (TPR) repeat protein